MQPDRSTRNATGSRITSIAIVAGSALLTLAGCTTVGDRLTGVRLNRSAPTTCSLQCANLHRALFDAERKRHMAEVEWCWSLPQAEKALCLEDEGVRHAAEMARLSQSLTDCQGSCRSGGHGG